MRKTGLLDEIMNGFRQDVGAYLDQNKYRIIPYNELLLLFSYMNEHDLLYILNSLEAKNVLYIRNNEMFCIKDEYPKMMNTISQSHKISGFLS